MQTVQLIISNTFSANVVRWVNSLFVWTANWFQHFEPLFGIDHKFARRVRGFGLFFFGVSTPASSAVHSRREIGHGTVLCHVLSSLALPVTTCLCVDLSSLFPICLPSPTLQPTLKQPVWDLGVWQNKLPFVCVMELSPPFSFCICRSSRANYIRNGYRWCEVIRKPGNAGLL